MVLVSVADANAGGPILRALRVIAGRYEGERRFGFAMRSVKAGGLVLRVARERGLCLS